MILVCAHDPFAKLALVQALLKDARGISPSDLGLLYLELARGSQAGKPTVVDTHGECQADAFIRDEPKLERGMTIEAPTPASPSGSTELSADRRRKSARTEFQESFKYEVVSPRSSTVRETPALEPNELEDLNLAKWLGVRDDFRNWLLTAA